MTTESPWDTRAAETAELHAATDIFKNLLKKHLHVGTDINSIFLAHNVSAPEQVVLLLFLAGMTDAILASVAPDKSFPDDLISGIFSLGRDYGNFRLKMAQKTAQDS